ncbi:tetratricopeptide repeat protein [Streptomyces mexicanus]|uniref:tetratricopeptide repeat protein n=1 Tax=Streptomyces mexicanus TaxID=178566 RepID=UPI0031E7A957
MSRLSREKKREHKRAARSAASTPTTPIAVHVPAVAAAGTDGSGSPTGAWASVDGVPVRPAPGEEIQQAVLDHLHRIALATGRPVHATVTDERIGYVVPLLVHGDGSSTFTAEPVRTAPPVPLQPHPAPPAEPVGPTRPPRADRAGDNGTGGSGTGPDGTGDSATRVLRTMRGPGPEPAPTFPLRAVPEPVPAAGTGPTVTLRAVPEPATGDEVPPPPPGTVAAPTGEFGPPPVMGTPVSRPASEADSAPEPVPAPETASAPEMPPAPETDSAPEAASAPEPAVPGVPAPAPDRGAAPAPDPDFVIDAHLDPDPKPTPARGFDAVAEAVLGEDPRTATGGARVVVFAAPLAEVNEAVRAGRIEEAAERAERTVTEASAALGADHVEVLRLRELLAYIAYLAGDPLRAFTLSLDLARAHHRAGDAEGAYGNVLSAATAWRAVRDPEQGLRLGSDLLALWSALAAEDGPAADDLDRLDSARARMGRLAERTGTRTPAATD